MTADNPAALGITPSEWEAIKQMPVMDAVAVIAARTLVAETEDHLRHVLHGETTMPNTNRTKINRTDQRAAEHILNAACVEVIRLTRAGEPHIRRYNLLRAAAEAVTPLLDPS